MCIQSFTEGHLGHVYLLAVVNLSAMNTRVQISLPGLASKFLEIDSEGGWLPWLLRQQKSSGD